MLDEFQGLPTHILLVHAVIVLVPIAALLTVLSAVWPAARRRLGIITPLVGLVALICHRRWRERRANGCRPGWSARR